MADHIELWEWAISSNGMAFFSVATRRLDRKSEN
jgi:hypothetical protein